MQKGADAFRSIGEVARLIGVAPHVLRYWETQFPQLKPMKRPDGRRYYRPDDVRLAAGLCELLREEGLTIRGAQKLLSKDRGDAVRARGAARLAGQDAPQPTDATDAAAPGPQGTAGPIAAPHAPCWHTRLHRLHQLLRGLERLPPSAHPAGLALIGAIAALS